MEEQIPSTASKTNSVGTVFALVNSMIGGTMLTLPLLFRDSGLITSSIILLVSGIISRKTCELYMQHLAQDQKDIQDSVKRILKGRWYEFFCLITGVYLIMLNVLYIVLINDQLYNIIKFALAMANKHDSLAPKDQFTFGMMSEQWLAVITFLPLLALLFIKNLGLLVKMTAVGVWSVFIYFIFVGYAFTDNLVQGNIHPSELKLFTWDIGNLAGTAALAFTIHTVVAPIMKTNQIQSNNTRDLILSYAMGASIYLFIGICGSMGIENRYCQSSAQTIIDCFPQDQWQPLVVSIMYLFGLVTVFPCFMDVSRQRLFSAFSDKPIPDMRRGVFNVCFMLISFGFEILAPYIKLSDIMNFNGAIFCFFFVYLIPIALHLKCYYPSDVTKESLISTHEALLPEEDAVIEGKCGHRLKDIQRVPRWFRIGLYCGLLLIGLATMVYGVYASVSEVFRYPYSRVEQVPPQQKGQAV